MNSAWHISPTASNNPRQLWNECYRQCPCSYFRCQHVTDSATTPGQYKMSHINWHHQTIPRPCKLQLLTFQQQCRRVLSFGNDTVSMGNQILMLLKGHNVLIFKDQLIFGHTASQYQQRSMTGHPSLVSSGPHKWNLYMLMSHSFLFTYQLCLVLKNIYHLAAMHILIQ